MASQSYTTPTTLEEVRQYVTSGDNVGHRSENTVTLNVEHSNLKHTRLAELRMDRRSTVAQVKDRLYLHTGTRPASMRLILRDPAGGIKRHLCDEAATLQSVAAATGDSLLLLDGDPNSVSANGALDNVSLVEKYVLSEDAYNKKENSYRKFKARMRKSDPNWSITSQLAGNVNAVHTRRAVDLGEAPPPITVGSRCEVNPGGKRAEVCFVGRDLKGLPEGWWIGVRYDEPVGKNNGTVNGVCYFEAEPKFGGLARPSNVVVGHFPPLDDDLSSGDEI